MAQLNLNTVRQNIEPRLATRMASNPATTVVFGNQPFDPPSGYKFYTMFNWIYWQYYITLGITSSSTNSQTGIITFNIFTKVGIGLVQFNTGKKIKGLYNRVILNGIYFGPPTGPAVLETQVQEVLYKV